MKTIEYRVVSDTDGWITEYDNRQDAKKRAEQLNDEHGVPNDHHVEEHEVEI